jgi:hypothetical protein
MSLNALLIHTCTVVRPSYTTDAYENEQPDYSSPVKTQTQVPCRLIEKRKLETINERAESAVGTVYLMLFLSDADVQPRDRITRVTLEDRRKVNAIFSVKEPPITKHRARRMHHLSVVLEMLS